MTKPFLSNPRKRFAYCNVLFTAILLVFLWLMVFVYLCRQEIEEQMIKTSKDRLDRIEDDSITKVRLHRSTSLSETSMDVSFKRSSSVGDTPVFWQKSPPELKNTINLNGDTIGITDKILEDLVNIGNDSATTKFENGGDSKDSYSQGIGTPQGQFEGIVENGSSLIDDAVDEDDVPDSGVCVNLSIDSETVTELEEMFGKIVGRPAGTCSQKFTLKESELYIRIHF